MIVLPNLACGGTERTAVELGNLLVENSKKVTILLMYKQDKFYYIQPSINLVEPSFDKKAIGNILYFPYLIFYLRSNFKKNKPDVIFALGYIAYSLFSSIGLNTRVIISHRSSPSKKRFPNNNILNFFYSTAYKIMRRRINGIIAQTSIAADAYKKKFKCPVVVIPNFIRELKTYNCERLNQIITVSRCSKEKGIHHLVNAFSKINASGWNLVIVGDGPLRKELEDLVNKLGLKNHVIFTGFQKDVDLFLSQSRIFALTSTIEGFPNALIEAMATPLAPVSFNCDAGPGEIITHGKNGFLVEVGDIDGFAYYLNLLISDDSLREKISSEAYNARKIYSVNSIGKKYIDFLFPESNDNPSN